MIRTRPVALITLVIALVLAGACCTSSRTRESQVPAATPLSSIDAGSNIGDSGAASSVQDQPRMEWGGGQDASSAAAFQACDSDSDCVAAPRVGCCHNGWMEAVAVLQRDAYLASFTCPEAHPICAMYIVRDNRKPRCDKAAHLCRMHRE
ncbi:MAG: hypothetical protein ACREJ3_00585 [Polyangiaceae bacterium]